MSVFFVQNLLRVLNALHLWLFPCDYEIRESHICRFQTQTAAGSQIQFQTRTREHFKSDSGVSSHS